MAFEMTVIRKIPVQEETDAPKDRLLVSVSKGGKAVEGINSERIKFVEEEVIRWENAGHLHAWFMREDKKVEGSNGSLELSRFNLHRLLTDCEKVLFASHLVPTERYSRHSWWWSREEREALGKAQMVIKNMSTAHRLMPIDTRYGGPTEYDGEYLKAVEQARLFAAQILAQKIPGPDGTYYYSWAG